MTFALGWIAGATCGFAAALIWVAIRADGEQARRDEMDLAATCRWPCGEPATVSYVVGSGSEGPIYCEDHADEMDRVDAELGYPCAKVRA